jgi:CHAP domain
LMATALDVLNVARTQIGFHEGANNSNPYGKWYGIPNAPYCAMGISWCFAQVGLSHLIAAQSPKGFSLNSAALPWFQRQGMIVNKFQGQPGDLVFYDWNGDGVADHVELLEAASAGGITTIGFNTGNPNDPIQEGCFQLHRNYLFVIAIVRPKYPVLVKPTTSVSTSKKATAAVGATGTAVAGATAALHGAPVTHTTTPAPVKSPTVFVAAPFPTNPKAFIIGSKNGAALTIEKALAKAGYLEQVYVTGTMNSQTVSALSAYEKKLGISVKAGLVPAIVYNTLKATL